MSGTLFKLETYVPETHLEQVKTALFQAGAGKVGLYDRCCWCTAGTGGFRPLAGSSPFLGECGKEEHVPEIKLECVVEESALKSAVAALKTSHPYETPAFACWRINEGL